MTRVINIFVFGASTTYGCWDPEGGWVARLRRFLDEKSVEQLKQNPEPNPMYLVYNQGIPADDLSGILKRFDSEVSERIDPGEENIILIHTGTNDSLYNNQTKSLKFSPDQYKQELIEVAGLTRRYSAKIVLVGTMPVDQRVDPIPWLPNHSYKNEYVAKFNEIMEEVSQEEKIHFIEIYNHFSGGEYQHLLVDGVHPNSRGHQQVFEIVRDYLLDKKII
ncbi:hypothetical protein HYW42_01420 [Candidatus Daviesbacteria bacterium]|nr:hypothetical protein [Candidatus Daviesbacteria bacterium]